MWRRLPDLGSGQHENRSKIALATLIQGLEWPDGAYRKLDWGSRCEKNLDPKRALKEFGIEHQLQLARPFRLGLATIQFETLVLLVPFTMTAEPTAKIKGVEAAIDQVYLCVAQLASVGPTDGSYMLHKLQ
jgi:hypothetical protein